MKRAAGALLIVTLTGLATAVFAEPKQLDCQLTDWQYTRHGPHRQQSRKIAGAARFLFDEAAKELYL